MHFRITSNRKERTGRTEVLKASSRAHMSQKVYVWSSKSENGLSRYSLQGISVEEDVLDIQVAVTKYHINWTVYKQKLYF